MEDDPGGSLSVEIKADPEAEYKPVISERNGVKTAIKVKYEEPEDDTVDYAIPIADDSDEMFADSDDQDEDEEDDESTEDEIVDSNFEGLVHIQGIEHFVCKSFKIRQIPQPEVRMIDLQSLFGCLEYGSIVLTPEYQREAVWDEHRASTLISSISMGYFVPPIIFNRKLVITETPDGKKSEQKKVCVDGKQRLTAIFNFMSGKIGIWDSNNPQKKWYFCHPTVGGEQVDSHHNIMPQAVKDFFRNRRLCCYEYEELSKDTEENMFQLVQRGIALTPAEKMRAMSTEWAAFAKQYVEDYSIVVNLSKQHRASGFRSVTTIFAMIQEVMAPTGRSTVPMLQASAQALNKLLEDKEPINPVLKLKFKTIFDRIETLVKLSSTQLTATKYKLNKNSVFDPAPDFLREEVVSHVRSFSPVELISTAVLVAYHMETRTNEELLNDVKNLRHRLRLRHKDLRVNSECWKTAWLFISRIGTPAESIDYVPPARRKQVKKKVKRPAKAKKPKAGAQVKKKQKPVSKAKARAKPKRTRKTNRHVNSASSSELSAPPSDNESSDEFTSGISSPLFPNILSARRSPSTSALVQSHNQSNGSIVGLPPAPEEQGNGMATENGQSPPSSCRIEDQASGRNETLDGDVPTEPSEVASGLEESHKSNIIQPNPNIDKEDIPTVVTLEAHSLERDIISDIVQTSSRGPAGSIALSDPKPATVPQVVVEVLIQNPNTITRSVQAYTSSELKDIITNTTDHIEEISPPRVSSPREYDKNSKEDEMPREGNEHSTAPVSCSEPDTQAIGEDSSSLVSSLLPVFIKSEPRDDDMAHIIFKAPPTDGNIPPKPKSRFKPRVPLRPERRPNNVATAAIVSKDVIQQTEALRPVSKRPLEESYSLHESPLKKSKDTQ